MHQANSPGGSERRHVRHIKAHGSDIRHIGAVAAGALDAISAAIYGEARGAAHALTDGDAILLIVRLPDGVDAPSQLEAIQRMVGTATHRRTGVMLRAGGIELEPARGLAVLAFERVTETSDDQPADAQAGDAQPGDAQAGDAQPGDAQLPVGPVRGTG